MFSNPRPPGKNLFSKIYVAPLTSGNAMFSNNSLILFLVTAIFATVLIPSSLHKANNASTFSTLSTPVVLWNDSIPGTLMLKSTL